MISKTSKNNFGWNIKTHKKITKYAIKHCDFKLNDEKYSKRIVKYSKQPDLDETQLHSSSHFCFAIPENMKPRRFLSFMDFSGKNNALAKYIRHIKKAQKHLSKDNLGKALEHLGRATHYLQDMCVPLHTEKGSFFRKLVDSKMHLKYEIDFVNPRMKTFLRPQIVTEPNIICETGFQNFALNLFKSNFDFSSKLKISKQNEHFWGEIAQVTTDKAVSSTQELLTAFSQLDKSGKIFQKK